MNAEWASKRRVLPATRCSLGYYHWAVLAETFVAAGLSLANLGRLPLWRDEAASVAIATRSTAGMLQVIAGREANMGLYYACLHYWSEFGVSESWVRALSVLFATATIPTVVFIARRVYGDRTALLAGLLLALNGSFLGHAREARTYSMVMLLTALATLLLLVVLERPTKLRWSGFIVTAVLAVYASPLAILTFASEGALLAVAPPSITRGRRQLVPFMVIYGLAAPLAGYVALRQSGQTDWIPRTTLESVLGVAADLGGSSWQAAILSLPLGAALCSLLATLGRGRGSVSWDVWQRFLVATWLVGPPLLLLLISVFKPLMLGRYLAGCIPAVAILVAVGVTMPRRPAVVALAVAVTIIASVLTIADRIYARPPPEDLRAAARLVLVRATVGDAIGFAPAYARLGFDYYLQREVGPQKVPADVAVALNGLSEQVGDEYAREVSAETLGERLDGYERLWVVGYPGDNWHPTPEPMIDVLTRISLQGFHLVMDSAFGDVHVALYARSPTAANWSPPEIRPWSSGCQAASSGVCGS